MVDSNAPSASPEAGVKLPAGVAAEAAGECSDSFLFLRDVRRQSGANQSLM